MKHSRILALILALCLVTSAVALTELASLDTVNGAQIRTTGNQGLRFISRISDTEIEEYGIDEWGTVLLPSADLDDPNDLVIDYTAANGHKALTVPAVYTFEIEGDTRYFTAVLTDIDPDNYEREYTARAYAKCSDGSIVYSDAFSSRNVYTVATAALNDTSADYTDEEKAVFENVKKFVDGYTIPVTFTKPKENGTITKSLTVDGYTATISWTKGGKALASTDKKYGTYKYTCTITLTAEEKISKNAKISINGTTCTTTRSADGKTISAEYTYNLNNSGWSGIY